MIRFSKTRFHTGFASHEAIYFEVDRFVKIFSFPDFHFAQVHITIRSFLVQSVGSTIALL